MRAEFRCLAHCLLVAALAPAAGAQEGTLKQIVPGVWFREGEMDQSHSNNAIIEMKDCLVVVDANYPSGAKLVIADAKKVSPKPIKYVIDTHADADHLYGNPIFTKLGAVTIGHVAVLDDLKQFEPKFWRQTAGWRKDVAELNLAGPEPPQQTFSESPYVIGDSSRRIELHHFTWGHTRADVFVYLPAEKVLCTGDAVVNGPYSDPKKAYMTHWADEIRPTLKFDVKHVLPGHGADGGKELLEGQIQFFDELHQAVAAAVKDGKKLGDVVTLQNGRPVATTIRLSPKIMDKYVFHGAATKPWQTQRFPLQVMATYQELTQGRPYGEIAAGK